MAFGPGWSFHYDGEESRLRSPASPGFSVKHARSAQVRHSASVFELKSCELLGHLNITSLLLQGFIWEQNPAEVAAWGGAVCE